MPKVTQLGCAREGIEAQGSMTLELLGYTITEGIPVKP